MNTRKITYENEYKGYPILTDKEKKQGCYIDILKAIKENMDEMTESHNKTLFMRYDIRTPNDKRMDDKTLRHFHANWMKNLKVYEGLDPKYVLVKEQSREKHKHYHGVLLLDGNKIQNIQKPLKKGEELLSRALKIDHTVNNGLINDCTRGRDGKDQKNGIMLRKDDPDYEDQKKVCMEWASYLAKENTKKNMPKGTRTFSTSRTRQKEN